MGSPAQFQDNSEEHPYVVLTFAADYFPGIYKNYPNVRFPTENIAKLFAEIILNSSVHIIKTEVFTKGGISIETFEGGKV